MLVDTRESSGVEEPAASVVVFQVMCNTGAAEEWLATRVDAHNITVTHVATLRRVM